MTTSRPFPPELGLEYELGDREVVTEIIEGLREERWDIIDSDEEFKSIERFRMACILAQALATELRPIGASSVDRELINSVYRTICFSLQLAELAVSSQEIVLPFGAYLDEVGETDDMGGVLRGDARIFFSTRPNVASLFAQYAPDLDTTTDNHWRDEVMTTGGVLFQLVERGIAVQYSS